MRKLTEMETAKAKALLPEIYTLLRVLEIELEPSEEAEQSEHMKALWKRIRSTIKAIRDAN